MKKLKLIIIAIILFFMLIMGLVVPIAYTGTAVFILGLYLKNQKKNGRFASKIIDWIPLFGVILFLVLGMAFVEASEVADKKKNTQELRKVKDEEKIKAESII